jgi:D-3-phosphoglycerate dehydrogenase
MKLNKYIVIDFDSTFTKLEAFDLLAEISLKDHQEAHSIKEQIRDITNQAMEGKLSFRESLEKRVALLAPNKTHLNELAKQLKDHVSESFKRNRDFLGSMLTTFMSFPMAFTFSSIR